MQANTLYTLFRGLYLPLEPRNLDSAQKSRPQRLILFLLLRS